MFFFLLSHFWCLIRALDQSNLNTEKPRQSGKEKRFYFSRLLMVKLVKL
jgi:hypothetical protein